MKKIYVKLVIVTLSFLCLLPPAQLEAKSSLKGYTIDITSLNSTISKYITSLNFEEQIDGSFSLYINNEYVGNSSNDPASFVYYPNSLTSISISISSSNETINFYLSQSKEEIYNSAFVFTIDKEGAQSVTFYPIANSLDNAETKTTKGVNGIYDFGSFNCTLSNKEVSFSLILDANNNVATITKNGETKSYSVTKTTTTRTLYFENFVEGHPLDMNYMEKDLAKQTFSNAKTIDYSDSDVDAAVQNETLTLINKTTNKSYTVPLRRTIDYWDRTSGSEVGTGEYGSYGQELQVVCEWYDAACTGIREKYGEDGRLFAVYGSSTSYPAVISYIDTKLDYPTLYKNVRWGSWTSVSMAAALPSDEYTYAQYRTQTKSWSAWSQWTENYNVLAFNGTSETIKGEQKEVYKYRTYTWKATGGWSTNSSYCSYISSTDSRTQSKTAIDEACGVETYKLCANKNAGCKTYNTCTTGNCGYATCRNSGCGCETYNQKQDYSCGTTSVKTSDTGCRRDYTYSCNCSSYSCNCSSYSCNCRYWSCNCQTVGQTCRYVGGAIQCYGGHQECSTCSSCSTCTTCDTCTSCDTCSGVAYDNPCYSTINKTCRKAAFGCETWKECQHQGCGYASCQNEACGCAAYNSSRDETCGVETYKSCTLYQCELKEYSDWMGPKDTCPYLSGVDSECKSDGYLYRYSEKILGDWSEWIYTNTFWNETAETKYQHRYKSATISWDEKKGTSNTLGTDVYYTGESKKSTEAKYVTDTFAKVSTITIGSLAEMTAGQIAQKTEEIKQALMLVNAYNTIKSDDGYTLYEDVVDYKNTNSLAESQAYEEALSYFENKTIFIPYMYITSHWRAVSAPGEVSGYDNESVSSITTTKVTSTKSQGMALIAYDVDLTKDTKIIYFDYRDPLINYKDELPENWQGYEELIKEIQQSDLSNYKIEIEMSRKDIEDMRKYLKNHNYKSENCEMLREFSYIFKSTDQDLANFLANGSGCKIEGD